jgi:hypothetical protein
MSTTSAVVSRTNAVVSRTKYNLPPIPPSSYELQLLSRTSNNNDKQVSMGTDSPINTNSLQAHLTATGDSGQLSFGVVNLVFYSVITLMACHFVRFNREYSGRPGRELSIYVSKISFIVWLCSFATKMLRLSSALYFSPLADYAINSVSNTLHVEKFIALEMLAFTVLTIFAGMYASYIYVMWVPKNFNFRRMARL